MSSDEIFWLMILGASILIEVPTVGLVSIWFAIGSVPALIAAHLGAGFLLQCGIFLVVSLVLLLFTRPVAVKYISSKKTKTNYESLIGKMAQVTETVNNSQGKGAAKLDGKEWTARSSKDDVILEAGTQAIVDEIQGVKLILSEKK